MVKREWFAPLVHAEAEYLAPMRFGDAVVVHVVKVRCGTSAATVGYRIVSENGRPLAVGHTVHVFVDGKTFRPCPIPPDVLRALTIKPTVAEDA
jgi:acyl-CoA thioesterase FadM